MANKTFNEKQKEIVARKLGYNGPMEGFDKFVKSDPAMERKLNLLTSKFMARGGAVRKFAEGGSLRISSEGVSDNLKITSSDSEKSESNSTNTKDAATPTPVKPTITSPKVEKITPTTGQDVAARRDVGTERAGAGTAEPVTVSEVAKTDAPVIKAEKSRQDVKAAIELNEAAIGAVSQEALAKAQTMDPQETALMEMEAARLANPREVVGAPIRELQAEELVSGPAVNNAQVEATLNRVAAATAAVTPEMTVQGQLDKLLKDFDAGNPPYWAASSLRNANAVLAARGLGASSLAGQAVIQATLEAAVPIAAQDAQTTATLELQNLSNRQQTAMLVAQQRAAFLGQEFDQAFQTRVANAARIADIANQNFSAGTQIALENARLAQTVDLANLSNQQAMIMARAAQIANIETANLNNRQQAAVQNAQAFLQMDLTNLSNQQQMSMLNAQSRIQSVMTDTAAENATRQFNAANEIQVQQFYDNLNANIKMFNAAQQNSMEQFNVGQSTAVSQFNSQQRNAMEQFNAQNRLVVDQSNAEWRRNIATVNTATQNNANMFDAQAGLQVNMAEYNNMWQSMRDTMEYAFKASESFYDRQNTLAIATLQKQAAIEAAKFQLNGEKYKALGNLTSQILGGSGIAGDIYDVGKSIFKDIAGRFTGGDAGPARPEGTGDVEDQPGGFYGDDIDLSWLDEIESGLDLGGADLPDDYFDYDVYT